MRTTFAFAKGLGVWLALLFGIAGGLQLLGWVFGWTFLGWVYGMAAGGLVVVGVGATIWNSVAHGPVDPWWDASIGEYRTDRR